MGAPSEVSNRREARRNRARSARFEALSSRGDGVRYLRRFGLRCRLPPDLIRDLPEPAPDHLDDAAECWPRVAPPEERLVTDQPRLEDGAVGSATRSQRPADRGPVRDLVQTVAADLISLEHRHRQRLGVEVAHPGQIRARLGDMADQPERSGVELDDLESSIACVEFELDVEDAAVLDRGQERAQCRERALDVRERDRHVRACVGETWRIRPKPTARDQRTDRPVPVDESIDEERPRGVTRDVLLEHEGDTSGGGFLDQAASVVPGLDEEPLRAERAVVGLRFRRLEEARRKVLVRESGEVGHVEDRHASRPWQVQLLGECPEAVLVDERPDGLVRSDARGEPLAEVLGQPGHGQGPRVAACDQDGARDVERPEVLGEDLGIGRFAQRLPRRPVPTRTDDDVRRVVDDVRGDAATRECPQNAERGDMRPEDQDGRREAPGRAGHGRGYVRAYLIASGFTGEPTPPVIGRGGAENRNSYRPSEAQSSARASRSKISPTSRPMWTIRMMWSGWKTSGVSLGNTSAPHVSAATAAISCSWIQPTESSPSPGAEPPAYAPHEPSARHCAIWPVRISTMSPRPTVTPWASAAACRSLAWMTSPGSSQGTPFSRAMSSSTPRPTTRSRALAMSFRIAPLLPTSVAS